MPNSTELQMPERSMPAAAQDGGLDVARIANILSLQRLEVDEEAPYFGPSITSSFQACCYN
jgi:hypothetical protein